MSGCSARSQPAARGAEFATMNSADRLHRKPLQRAAGFTLIELMIAVIVVGILAAVAYPTFIDSIRKSRRSEAFDALARVQQAQERWRSNNPEYASSPSTLALPGTTAGGYYTVSITTVSTSAGVAYDATAVAVAGKSQALDSTCTRLGVRVVRGTITYGSCAVAGCTTLTYGPGDNCWKR
jgi:type IV pilus assembly protein PilE